MTKEINKRISTILVFGLLGFVLEFSYLRFLPDHKAIDMHSVEPKEISHNIGDYVRFITNASYRKRGHVTREDIYYCSDPGGDNYVFYQQYISSITKTKPSIVIDGERRYAKPGPDAEKDCVLHNYTTIELHYGIKKVSHVKSGIFYFRENLQ